jgi:hypothetical protein
MTLRAWALCSLSSLHLRALTFSCGIVVFFKIKHLCEYAHWSLINHCNYLCNLCIQLLNQMFLINFKSCKYQLWMVPPNIKHVQIALNCYTLEETSFQLAVFYFFPLILWNLTEQYILSLSSYHMYYKYFSSPYTWFNILGIF